MLCDLLTNTRKLKVRPSLFFRLYSNAMLFDTYFVLDINTLLSAGTMFFHSTVNIVSGKEYGLWKSQVCNHMICNLASEKIFGQAKRIKRCWLMFITQVKGEKHHLTSQKLQSIKLQIFFVIQLIKTYQYFCRQFMYHLQQNQIKLTNPSSDTTLLL